MLAVIKQVTLIEDAIKENLIYSLIYSDLLVFDKLLIHSNSDKQWCKTFDFSEQRYWRSSPHDLVFEYIRHKINIENQKVPDDLIYNLSNRTIVKVNPIHIKVALNSDPSEVRHIVT